MISRNVSGEEDIGSLTEPLRYDVFVSYGPSDDSRNWVTSVLYPKLASFIAEDHILFDEKALPNKNVISELADAIYTSRRAILVVTADYLNDSRRIGYDGPRRLDGVDKQRGDIGSVWRGHWGTTPTLPPLVAGTQPSYLAGKRNWTECFLAAATIQFRPAI